jgi:hypothetical protein
VEDVLACVDQRTLGLRKELNVRIDVAQVDLQLVMTSIDAWSGRHKGDITDTKEDCQEAIAKTRKDLHEVLDLTIQVEAQTTRAPN